MGYTGFLGHFENKHDKDKGTDFPILQMTCMSPAPLVGAQGSRHLLIGEIVNKKRLPCVLGLPGT